VRENRCIGLYRSLSRANVRKRAHDHHAAAGSNTTPDAHFHGHNEPTRMHQLRTLSLCIGRRFSERRQSG
jgi:hypothetical protein